MTNVIQGNFLVFSHFLDAFLTHVFSAVGNQPSGRTTEQACGLKFLQDDAITLHVDFQFIPLLDIQGAAQFDGQDNSS